ncbi:recombinase family protein [Cytobacillus sp. IB215665]|nr:recombinase family protein [Cytobacillus sp. IB215665]MDX8366725.1 recombinase family protein [Cytobacillus sp. IB215665]
MKELFEYGVRVNILNLGVIENTPTGRLIFNVFMSFAEFEGNMIIERTQEGKAIARQRSDYVEGKSKKYSRKQIEHAFELLESNSDKKVEEVMCISKSTLIRVKRLKGKGGQS